MALIVELKEKNRGSIRVEVKLENETVLGSVFANIAATLTGLMAPTMEEDTGKVEESIIREEPKESIIREEPKESIIKGEPKEPIIRAEIIADDLLEQIMATDTVPNTLDFKAKSEFQPVKTIMLFVKCECGALKAFKTNENVGKDFVCSCGNSYEIKDTIKVAASCPNCSRGISFRTLKELDIAEGLRCGTCESPIDLAYNKKKNRWENI